MAKGVIQRVLDQEAMKEMDLSCTFCGPGRWSTWEVVTPDGVSFTCDRHHAEMSQANLIRLERMKGKETWNEIPEPKEIFCEEEYVDDLKDANDYD